MFAQVSLGETDLWHFEKPASLDVIIRPILSDATPRLECISSSGNWLSFLVFYVSFLQEPNSHQSNPKGLLVQPQVVNKTSL